MLPGKKKNPLLQIEQEAERKAQAYKKKLIQEALEKLAAEESEAIFPPAGDDLSPDKDAPANADDDRR